MRFFRFCLTLVAVAALLLPASVGRAQSRHGIWTSASELAGLPTSGKAWQSLIDTASEEVGTPDVSNQDDIDNVRVLAKALVYARTGASRYRDEVIAACMEAIGSEAGGRTLALGRELIAYVIAAELVGLPAAENQQFRAWLDRVRTSTLDGRTLISTHEERPNNWGTHAGATRAAIAVYLGDSQDLARTAQVFRGYLGDRSAHADFDYGSLSWQADAARPVGINPLGALRDGHSIDGVLPDDQRRGGDFVWPPPKENYVYEALQGALAHAVILYRAGYDDVWSWEDRALLRAFRWLHAQADFPAEGDDTWEPHVVNFYYGTSFPAPIPSRTGKNVGFTDWTHAEPGGGATLPPDPPDSTPVGEAACRSAADCDDGLWCNGTERCDAELGCQPGVPPACDDGLACTLDRCDEAADRCAHDPDDAYCDDGLFCDGREWCDPALGCRSGAPVDCADGIACTSELCDEVADRCVSSPVHARCNDGLECTVDVCAASTGCGHRDACGEGLICDPASGACQPTPRCGSDADCDDGNPCTLDACGVDGCVSTATAAACDPSIVYFEDFEAGLGAYRNVDGDDLDWTRQSGPTPSSNTGPSADHTTGADTGFYVYVESSLSDVGYPEKLARLEGPCLDLQAADSAELGFWYHMYGADIGGLDVEVAPGCSGGDWVSVFQRTGPQGTEWLNARIDLTPYAGGQLRVRFSAITGLDWKSDFALDDVSVRADWRSQCDGDADCDDGLACTLDLCTGGVCLSVADCPEGGACDLDSGQCRASASASCGAVDPADCLDAFPYAEDFESGLGRWRNSSADDIDWTRNQGRTPTNRTGPPTDVTTGDETGSYLYVESSEGSTNPPGGPNLTAVLESPCLDLEVARSARWTFWYSMHGEDMGDLWAEIAPDCGTAWETGLHLQGEQGYAFQQAGIDLTRYAGGRVRLRFRAVTGNGFLSDMAIDEVVLSSDP